MVSKQAAREKLEKTDEFANPLPEDPFKRNFIVVFEKEPDDEDQKTEYEFGKICLHSDIHQSLQTNIINRLVEYRIDLEQDKKQLEPYDVSNSGRHELIQYIETNDIPMFDRFTDLIERERFDETTFDVGNDDHQPKFQAMRIRGADSTVIVFQKYGSEQVVGKSWILEIITKEGNEYNTIPDNVFAIPKRIDALYVDGIIYSFNTRNFEKIFDHLHTYRENAKTVFQEIAESGISIHNHDEFYGYIKNDGNALRKMQQIADQETHQNLVREDVQKIINDFNLDLNIKNDDGEWGVEVPRSQNKWDMIRLLNDDHLQSEVTENKYRVYGKQSASE